jgi:two-component system response regulator PilR (NtrC family)
MITIDIGATVTSINEAARAIIGLADLEPEHFIGRPLRNVFKDYGIIGVEQILDKDSSGSGEVTIQGRNNENEVHLNYSVKPLADDDGNETGKLLIFDDVSHVRNMQERLDLHERMTKLLAETNGKPPEHFERRHKNQMVGESPVIQRVFALVGRVAASNASVLITGESGTGKELIAKAIHVNSPRTDKPFIAINCGAIPENLIESELFGHKKGSFTGAITDNPGLFKQAHAGTIFLDEIGELPLHLQTKLLRVLQEKVVRPVGDTRDIPVDVRIIAATNRDLKKEITGGRFREDLFYRLNVVNIPIPPLRERREDIPSLVQHFITRYSNEDQEYPQISPEALQLLTSYSYPGNVRELENIVERMLVLGGQAILPEHLPEEVLLTAMQTQTSGNGLRSKSSTKAQDTDILVLPIDLEHELSKLEKYYLNRALEQSGGVKKHAAELLGLNFRSFRYRVKKYGLGENNEKPTGDNQTG